MTKFKMNKGLCALYPIKNSNGTVYDYLFIDAGLRRHYNQTFEQPSCRLLAKDMQRPFGLCTHQELNTWAHMQDIAHKPWEDIYNVVWEKIPYDVC